MQLVLFLLSLLSLSRSDWLSTVEPPCRLNQFEHEGYCYCDDFSKYAATDLGCVQFSYSFNYRSVYSSYYSTDDSYYYNTVKDLVFTSDETSWRVDTNNDVQMTRYYLASETTYYCMDELYFTDIDKSDYKEIPKTGDFDYSKRGFPRDGYDSCSYGSSSSYDYYIQLPVRRIMDTDFNSPFCVNKTEINGTIFCKVYCDDGWELVKESENHVCKPICEEECPSGQYCFLPNDCRCEDENEVLVDGECVTVTYDVYFELEYNYDYDYEYKSYATYSGVENGKRVNIENWIDIDTDYRRGDVLYTFDSLKISFNQYNYSQTGKIQLLMEMYEFGGSSFNPLYVTVDSSDYSFDLITYRKIEHYYDYEYYYVSGKITQVYIDGVAMIKAGGIFGISNIYIFVIIFAAVLCCCCCCFCCCVCCYLKKKGEAENKSDQNNTIGLKEPMYTQPRKTMVNAPPVQRNIVNPSVVTVVKTVSTPKTPDVIIHGAETIPEVNQPEPIQPNVQFTVPQYDVGFNPETVNYEAPGFEAPGFEEPGNLAFNPENIVYE